MTFQSALAPLSPEESADYGFSRVRDLAFDAVMRLWSRRQAEGMTQKIVADKIGNSPATVSRNLRAPGNWTLRTFGELVQAMNGDVTITVEAAEDVLDSSNYDAYDGYGLDESNRADPQIIIFSNSSGPKAKDGPSGMEIPKSEIVGAPRVEIIGG